MKQWLAFLLIGLLALGSGARAEKGDPQRQAQIQKLQKLLEGLHPQNGDVSVERAEVVLHLGEAYYFLPPGEAQRVLTEAWENPQYGVRGVLGMIFPAGHNPIATPWGAIIRYEDSGYVSDDEAGASDYDAILKSFQEGEAERNEERVRLGFGTVHTVGWAQPPTYDRKAHSLIWAHHLRFSDDPKDGLNYDVRLLGRNGVLSLNIVSGMWALPAIREDAASLARKIEFKPGYRYSDYVKDVDKRAGYGLAGLVAAGIGVTAAKKLGLLAVLLPFAKKAFALVLVGLAFAWRRIVRLFRRGSGEGD